MTAVTVNQIFDKLLSKYKSSEIKKYPDVLKLKTKLFKIKSELGGNTIINNNNDLLNLIDNGFKQS